MLFIKAIKEIIILLIIIIINVPIIYFTIISLFFNFFSKTEPEKESDKDKTQTSKDKIIMTPKTFIKSVIIIAFIIGLFAAEIILVDKIGITYFDYPFIQKLLNPGM